MDFPIPVWLKQYIPIAEGVLLAIVLLVGGWIVSKWANRLTRRAFVARKLDPALAGFVAALAQYVVLAAAVISALGTVGIQTTSLVAVFASAGLAIGLALQGSLTNFASGVLILFFRPFDLHEKVTAGGQTGEVQEIGLFATTLLAPTGETITVPNSAVTGGSIVNFSRSGRLRGIIDVTVAHDDAAKVASVLEAAARRADGVLKDPAATALFTGLTANASTFTIYVWAKAKDLAPALRSARTAIVSDLSAAGIKMETATISAQAS